MNQIIDMKKHQVNKKLLYGLAFLLPVLMMLVVYIVIKAYPFGERSILVSDLRTQFVDYYSYFRSLFTSNDNFVYTFSKNMGGDMIGFSGYYLQNPFNLILLLFPSEMVSVAMMVIIALQLGLSGLCFNIFANHTNRPFYGSLFFSTAYAFMGYIFAYFTLPIYFTNIALLPLVMLGLHRLMNNPKHKWLYVFSLAASLFCNYYMGYMLCLFTIFYLVYLLALRIDRLTEIKKYVRHIISYITSSLLAAALMAWDLIPIALSLSGQKNAPEANALELYRKFKMTDVFTQLYANVFNGNLSNSTFPYLYVGVLAVICLGLFFTAKAISRKEKLLSAGIFFTLLVCMYINTLDTVFHAFNEPVGFAYRYAYLASFLLLCFAMQGWQACKNKIERRQLFIIAAIFVIYSLYLLATKNTWVKLHTVLYNGTLLLVMGAAILLVMRSHGKAGVWRNIMVGVLGMISIIDLTGNAVHSISQYPASSMEEYTQYLQRVKPLTEYVKNYDNGFYRMEKNFERTHNDAMQFQYQGLSHFSSCEKDIVRNFARKMGFATFGQWAYYNLGSTTFVDNFLGVKYLINKYDATGKPYEKLTTINELTVFQNPYALPLGFGVTKQVEEVILDTDNLFHIQNEIAGSFGDGIGDIYTPAEGVVEKSVNAVREEEGETVCYRKQNAEDEAYVQYTIPITNENMLFLFWNAPHVQGAEVFINDYPYEAYFTNTKWDILEVGSYQIGEEITVKLVMKEDTLKIDSYLFYYENADMLQKWHESALAAGTADIEKISSSHLKGSIKTSDNTNYLLFSIPYEKDWQIWIDGKRTDTVMLLDALLAVPVSAGEHTIEMRYIPIGWYVGIPISIAAIGIVIYQMKRKVR